MDRALWGRFVAIRELLDDPDYLAATIAFGAAPTLAGIKPATLLAFTSGGRDLHGLWGRFKHEAAALLALEYFELVRAATRTLVLFYRRGALEKQLADPGIASFLTDLGYETGASPADTLLDLRGRSGSTFPHEIGVLLGIPVEDVRSFMEHGGKDCLCSGYWKVYHDPARAGRIFRAYDRARNAAAAAFLDEHGQPCPAGTAAINGKCPLARAGVASRLAVLPAAGETSIGTRATDRAWPASLGTQAAGAAGVMPADPWKPGLSLGVFRKGNRYP